jgi:Retroviral aspartyl protease
MDFEGYVSDDDFDETNIVENYPDGADLVSALESSVAEVLSGCQPFPGDGLAVDPTYHDGDRRFVITPTDPEIIEVYDQVQGFETHISVNYLLQEDFSVGRWFAEQCAVNMNMPQPWKVAQEWFEASLRRGTRTTLWPPENDEDVEIFTREMTSEEALELDGVQVDRSKYPSLQRNSAQIKGNGRLLPEPVVLKIKINGHPVRALLDSGSLGDFVTSTLVDQLSVTREALESPLALHLAVQGSRLKVNARATVKLKYQGINKTRTLDIINLNSYDVILGTPWMYQHKVCLGFNPARVVVGADEVLPLRHGIDTKLMVSLLSPEKKTDRVRQRGATSVCQSDLQRR